MKMHKVVLDIAMRLVYLNSPMYGKVSLHLPMKVGGYSYGLRVPRRVSQ
jgi:hypothetical protein